MVATGIDFNVDDAMSNPLLTATSPSDFWGRKWNLIVHSVLKNGVFKPVYNFTYNRPLAVLSCFVASGLFHEWILWCKESYQLKLFFCNKIINTHCIMLNLFIIKVFTVALMTVVIAVFLFQYMENRRHFLYGMP